MFGTSLKDGKVSKWHELRYTSALRASDANEHWPAESTAHLCGLYGRGCESLPLLNYFRNAIISRIFSPLCFFYRADIFALAFNAHRH